MRLLNSLIIVLLIFACSNNKKGDDSSQQNKSKPLSNQISSPPNVSVPANMTPVSGPPPSKDYPPQNAKGIWHYTCPKSCPGGGGGEIPCPKCGVTLVHNPSYHQ